MIPLRNRKWVASLSLKPCSSIVVDVVIVAVAVAIVPDDDVFEFVKIVELVVVALFINSLVSMLLKLFKLLLLYMFPFSAIKRKRNNPL